ncbi:MAG: dihydroorotate dehydrogenase-like protein [Spirochaetales bacterium]|nr:dihydroorotate dehydrogenase-like protein [Spirochaetales bacterium]
MADLSISYMGIPLKNPVIAGASGLTAHMDTIKKIEDAGAGALVCKSLFEEEVNLESLQQQRDLHKYDDWHAEMITIFPDIKKSGPENHLYWVRKTKETVGIPVIASLNAVQEKTWVAYSGLLEQTGVDGLEINLYTSPVYHLEASDNIEDEQIAILKKIREAVSVPVSVKLSPYYTNVANFITRCEEIGIDGFVLFNRHFQSSIDIDKEDIIFPFNFSRKEDALLSLRYAGLLYGNVTGTICSSNGITDADDAIRVLLAGSGAVQVVSTLFRNGIGHLSSIIDGIASWMDKKGYGCIDDFRGKMSRERLGIKDTWIYKRTQYIRMLMQNSESLMKKVL